MEIHTREFVIIFVLFSASKVKIVRYLHKKKFCQYVLGVGIKIVRSVRSIIKIIPLSTK